MGDKKSNFSVTCSLLSQYLKQNGSLGDLCLKMTPKSLLDNQLPKGNLGKSRTPTTMSLLPGVDVSEDNQTEDSPRSMDLFPQHTGLNTVAVSENIKEQAKAQTLTIFYNGKVFVTDNFPADKANDLFQMASKESTAVATKVAQNVGFKAPPPPVVRAEADSKPSTVLASTSGTNEAAVTPQNSLSKPANASDMPIARRNSLNRFLEKRKDRINTAAPYQVQGNGFSAQQDATKSGDDPSWLGLGPQNSKPDKSPGSGR